MVPNHEMKGDYYVNSCFFPIEKRTLILKMAKRELFLTKPKHEYINPRVENEFMVPNHWKKGDYYVDRCLSN